MKTAVFAIAVFGTAAAAYETNPIAKVVQMLSDLEGKIIKEGEVAQKEFSAFSEWCEDRSRNVGFEIKTGKSQVADLKASIEKETADSSALDSRIGDLASSISTDEADRKAATQIRAKEAATFAEADKELSDVVSTLERAISILSREMRGGASMVQLKNAGNVAQALKIMVDASVLSSADESRLTALVQSSQQSDSDDSDAGAPDAAVYKSHSGNIVDTLQDLLEKAESQQGDARKSETNERHNFEMLAQSLDDEIKFAQKDMAAAKKALAKSGESKAIATGDLEVTSKDLAADIETKSTLHRDCSNKATDFEAATKSRAEELKALAEAKKVITESTGGAESLEYGLAQSFIERSAIHSGADLAHFEAVRYVRDLATKQNSAELAQLAIRMASAMRAGSASGDDPFAKVKGLISDMLARLEDSASADASEKAYCDKELSESNTKKSDKNSEIEKLSTSIDQMSAKSAQLKSQVAALQKFLASLASAQAAANKNRQDEHATFVSDKADMEQGLEGIKLALKLLRDYYGQGEAAHAAAEGAGAGIISLLEVCESDFSKSLAEINATEDSAQSVYERMTKENEIEKAAKDQDVKYKSAETVRLDKSVAEAKNDRSNVQAELDAILDYLKQLTARCVAKAETYSERTARRDAELAGLKEALEILENQAALVQTAEHRHLRHVKAHAA